MINLNNKTDVIILSLVKDPESFAVTKRCIKSYLEDGTDVIDKIFVVETNPDFNESYGMDKVEIIKPGKEFNYNEFYNIGLERCKNEFVAGPNNDIVLYGGCLQRIIREFNENENIHSISPVDRNWHRHDYMYLPNHDKLYYGYNVSLHMFGCMFCCRRSVFETIGYLDETFYFFYQDNDYVMCLERCGLHHGVHTGATITHQPGRTDRIADTKFKYLPENMHSQGELLHRKWGAEPFKSGGYKKFKEYTL